MRKLKHRDCKSKNVENRNCGPWFRCAGYGDLRHDAGGTIGQLVTIFSPRSFSICVTEIGRRSKRRLRKSSPSNFHSVRARHCPCPQIEPGERLPAACSEFDFSDPRREIRSTKA